MARKTTRRTTRRTPVFDESRRGDSSGKKLQKPVWPYPFFVERRRESDPGMTAHVGCGQWVKRHRGVMYYFGTIDDPESALADYQHRWPGIKAGRPEPSRLRGGAPSVEDVLNRFIHAKRQAGISAFTVEKIVRYCCLIGPILGLNRDAESLGPDDFARLRYSWSAYAPTTITDIHNYTKSAFRWAAARRVIESEPDYGPDFTKPSRKDCAAWRDDRRLERPPLIKPETFEALLEHATPWMRAVLLMSMNCGFGPSDLAIITPSHIRLSDGWLDASRSKTRVARVAELWPETIAAIHPIMKLAGKNQPIFTSRGGKPIAGDDPKRQPLKNRFDRLRVKAGCERHVFIDIRRTFSTVASHVAEPNTVKLIMGHTLNRDITMTYVQRYPPHKIRDACRFVRSVMLKKPWKRATEQSLTPKAARSEIFG
ncbi:hypothetical protein JYT11_00390 [Planctomycetaceae bacterium AH-315-I19]|nr:hypothetical protein [Planctomycetaceae bacterium AH-315-I19]